MTVPLELLQPDKLSCLIENQAARNPTAVAVKVSDEALTYADLAEKVAEVAAALSTQSLHLGDLVTIQIAASFRHWLVVLASLRLGLCSASLPLGDPKRSGLSPAFLIDEQTKLTTHEKSVPPPRSTPSTPTKLFQSSGTTGMPKTVMLDLAHLSRRLIGNADTYRVDANTRALSLIGPGTTSGFSLPLLTWAAGGTVVFPAEYSVRQTIAAVARANTILASPVSIAAVMDNATPTAFGGNNRMLFLAGARVTPHVRSRALERLCNRLTIMYGAMEIGGGCRGDASLIDRHPGAVGFPRRGTAVEVVDDNDVRVAPGVEGNIRMRSDLMAHSYVQNPTMTAENFRNGWFYPGDRGLLAADGMLAVTGRSDDIINIGGFKVHPLSIENALGQIEGISDLCALNVPTATGEDRLIVALVPRMDVDWAAVTTHVKAAVHTPFVAVRVPRLPYNDAGKVDRRRLAREIASQLTNASRDPIDSAPRATPTAAALNPEQSLAAANLPYFAERLAAQIPGAIAVLSSGMQITFAEMAHDVAVVAAQLAAVRGQGRGNIGHHCRNQYLNWLVIQAGLRLGVATVLLSPAATKTELQELDVTLVATDVPELARTTSVATVAISHPGRNAPTDAPPTPKTEWARLMQSSATTGRRKIVALDLAGLAMRLQAGVRGYDIHPDTRAFSMIGANTGTGLRMPMTTWAHGATVILTAAADSKTAVSALEQSTVAALSPRDLSVLVQQAAMRPPVLRGRHLFVGGGPLPRALRDAALASICDRITIFYGATEIGNACRGDSAAIARHPGAVGFPRDGVEIDIVDENGQSQPRGNEGRVRLRAATLVTEYLGNAELTNAFFRDGWFYPGDIGLQYPDGLVAITGRAGDVMNLGGTKLAPALIETAIGRVPGLGDLAASSIKHAELGEQLVIAAVPTLDCNWLIAREFIDRALIGFPPRLIVELDAIPRGELGKVDRRQLAQKVSHALAQAKASQPSPAPQSLTPEGRSAVLGDPATGRTGE